MIFLLFTAVTWKEKCTTSPNPFSLQGEEEPEFFLVPLSFARRGARGEVFRNFHVTSFIYSVLEIVAIHELLLSPKRTYLMRKL